MVVFEGTTALAKEKKTNATTKRTKETNVMMEKIRACAKEDRKE